MYTFLVMQIKTNKAFPYLLARLQEFLVVRWDGIISFSKLVSVLRFSLFLKPFRFFKNFNAYVRNTSKQYRSECSLKVGQVPFLI